MEDDEAYEIIYEEGVPLIAFQICPDSETVDNDDSDVLVNADASFESEVDQTLQYFKEDEREKIYHDDQSVILNPMNNENKANLKNDSFKKEGHIDNKDLDFVIVRNATKSNSKKLYDSHGYSYTLRNVKVTENCSIWRCRYKMSNNKECGGKAKITNDDQIIIMQNHRHAPDCPVPFSVLQETKVEPPKLKNYSYPYSGGMFELMKTADHANTENCEKMLDYFSEGSCLENSNDENEMVSRNEEDSNLTSTNSTHLSQIMYKVVKNGSLTGTRVLYDSHGYSYSTTDKKVIGDTTTWGCQAVLSSDGKKCSVKVIQEGSKFESEGIHSHPPKRHTLLKINKMQIFDSTNENEEHDESLKRKLSKKINTSKKLKKISENEGENALPLNNIKNDKEESFQFNSNEISFLVSLENNENEPLKEKRQQLQRSQIEHKSQNTTSSKLPVKELNFTVKKENKFGTLKEIARLAFSGKVQSMEHVKYFGGSHCPVQGIPKLFDSRGFIYTVRNQPNGMKRNWFCICRTERMQCKAKIIETESEIILQKDHTHEPEREKYIRSLIRMDLMETIKNPSSKHRSGMSLVREVIDSYGIDFPFSINPNHLVRFVNSQKKSSSDHQEEETKSSFNKKKVPKNFLLEKIVVDQKFHLTFANEIQLAYLASASEWYIDEADFDIKNFTNLLSIHVFVEQDGRPVQIPVFFAFVSDRRESDYTHVFSSIKSSLNKPPIVSSIIIDLNVPLRRSLSKGFPNSEIKCCDFHWSEDIACKIKEMDLSNFLDDPTSMQCLYQLPLLNLLPRQDFENALTKIERESEDDSVGDLICYIRETFGDRSLWPPKYWSSFKMPIQVNNHQHWRKDLLNEGTHKIELYSFIRTLYSLSNSLSDNLKLMSKKKIKKHFIAQPDTLLSKVYKEWKQYIRGDLTCHILLDNLASIIHIF